MTGVKCPKCGRNSRTMKTRYGRRDWCCDLWSWDGAPLVNRATHEARKAAHAAFDPLWKHMGYKRSDAYAMLARELGLKAKDCHMKLMDEQTARKVPVFVKNLIGDGDIDLIEMD